MEQNILTYEGLVRYDGNIKRLIDKKDNKVKEGLSERIDVVDGNIVVTNGRLNKVTEITKENSNKIYNHNERISKLEKMESDEALTNSDIDNAISLI